MANPQKEHGYTPIANELLDALIRFRIPGELRLVFDAIMRKTYGFNKKSDAISLTQFMEMTGLKKPNVFRCLVRLIEHQIVIKIDYKMKIGDSYQINKDYQAWIPFVIRIDNGRKKNKLLSELITPVIRIDNKSLSELSTTKDKIHFPKERGEKVFSPTPSEITKKFFKGVGDLVDKKDSQEADSTRVFLQGLQEKYQTARKEVLWDEIKKFYLYWTELNATGKMERWQKEKTFQVDRRLVTWFGKAKGFQQGGNYQSRGRGLVE